MEENFTKSIAKFLNQLEELKPINTETDSQINSRFAAKAIIFDIYGTLLVSASGDIDLAQVKSQNLKLALEESGFSLNTDMVEEEALLDDILACFKQTIREIHSSDKRNGIKHPEIQIELVWKSVIATYIDKDMIVTNEDICYKTLTVIFELQSNKVWPMPHMKEVLEKLREKGIVLGIVSNAQFYTPIVMNYFLNGEINENEIICNFEEDLTVYSYKNNIAKPSEKLYKQLIPTLKNNYSINPSDVLFVGNDMLNDIYGAANAKLKTVLFAGDKRSLRWRKDKTECKDLAPDFIITDLRELLDLI